MVLGKLIEHEITAEIRSYLEIMLMLHLVAGELEDSEIENLIITITSNPKLQHLDSRQIIDSLVRAWEDIENEGIDCRMIKVAKALKEKDQRINAIGIAISIAASDGKIDAQERGILEKLQRVLNLTDDNIEESIERYGNIPLLLFITRNDLKGDSDIMSTLWKQRLGNNRLRMQELSNDLLKQVAQRSLTSHTKRMH